MAELISLVATTQLASKMDSPKRWDDIEYKLQRFQKKLISTTIGKHNLTQVEPTWEAFTHCYFAEELAFRRAIDVLVKYLVKHEELPDNVTAGERYYLGFRIQCAHDFLGMIFPPKAKQSPFLEIPKSWTDQQVIEWLLIELWVRRFDHWLKLNAIGVTGPFAFYGLTPADPAEDQ